MKHHGISPRHHQVLSSLSQLPRKIIARHSTDHLAEFVLHELALRNCFNLSKAAYFVDNSDFNCLKGVAGYDSKDHNGHTTWQTPEFDDHIHACTFNDRVRGIEKESYKRAQKDEASLISMLGQELSMHNPHCYVWDLKHDNYGVLLYEGGNDEVDVTEHVQNGICFLGFCPVM